MKAVAARRRRRWIMAVVGLVLLTGCRGGSGGATLGPGSAPTQSGANQTPKTTATPSVNREDLLTVYRAWWTAVTEAYARGEPNYPGLATYGVDPILTRQRSQIQRLRAQGIVQRTRLTLAPRILHQNDKVAEIADCVRGPAGTYYDVTTGQRRAPRGYRNEVPTEDPLLLALHKRGGYWYVVAATDKGVQPC